jgi:hypothetical protein
MKRFLLPVLLLFIFPSFLFSQNKLIWEFPLPRTHTGILLGNGTQGLMVWGSGEQLNITVARAGFWDHRGGNEFSARITYPELKKMLEAKDNEAIKAAFAVPQKQGVPNFGHPQQLGGGRLELSLPKGWNLERGDLLLDKGEIQIMVSKAGVQQWIKIKEAIKDELAWVELPTALQSTTLKLVSAYEFNQERLKAVGIQAPEAWNLDQVQGLTQKLPEDAPLTLAYRKVGGIVKIASHLGDGYQKESVRLINGNNLATLETERLAWWKNYWATAAKVSLPDADLQELHDYGLYKLACISPPQGVPATLQGPFMEEYQIVPWSNDYHFNINVQMIYYPALMSGKFDHLLPMWKMIEGWMPELQRNGEAFFGRKGALMLPHAVDDRCKVVGTFWTGTIDHACTGWMAQLAWLHYRYSNQREILEKYAYPLLIGAFEGYWAMLEEVPDGKGGQRFSLPVSVSPEYRGDRMDAWGKDASFQLAALHAVAQILPQAAALLNKPLDPRWEDVSKRLPPYTTFDGEYLQEWSLKSKRIALWEGMDLIESHRHHSHLGAIYPFVTIDPNSEEHRSIVQNSLATWRYRGAGGWSGWCISWASILLARTGQTEAAVNWIKYFKQNFSNEGRGTSHNANTLGNSIMGHPVWSRTGQKNGEIMQLDGGMGVVTAIYELLVQNRKDGLHVLPDRSIYWKNISFQNVRAEGGFKVSAKVSKGQLEEVKIECTADQELRLHHGFGEKYSLNGQVQNGKILQRNCKAGEVLVLRN